MTPQPHYCPHKIEMTACGDCNYIHSDCPYQVLKWDGEMIQKMLCGFPTPRPAPSPEIQVISVEPHPPSAESLRCDNTCPCRTPTCEETCPLYQHDAATAAQASEDALEKGIAVIKNRIDCIMISYEGEENEAITQRPYAMSDGMQECILMLESLRTEGGDE